MSDLDIEHVLPENISDLSVFVTNFKDEKTEITGIVNEISIYESIYSPFLYGELVIIDGAGAFNDIPFIGQEKIEIIWKRDDVKTTKNFYVIDVFNVTKMQQFYGAYGLTITSEEQMINSVSLFSKAYRGRSDQIIESVYSENFDKEIDKKVLGKSKHSVVFPFVKPFQAIDMILKNVLAEDNSMMFLFDTVNHDPDDENKVFLDSFAHMYEQDPFYTIEQRLNIETGSSNRLSVERQGQVNSLDGRGNILEETLPKTFPVLDQIVSGAFSSRATILDTSLRTNSIQNFDYKSDFDLLTSDHISEKYKIRERSLNELNNTQHSTVVKNSLAFEDTQFPNLNTVDNLDKQLIAAWNKRMETTTVDLGMDSIDYVLDLEVNDNNRAFRVGKTVEYKSSIFNSRFTQREDDKENKIASGKYLITCIRHYIKSGKYTMSLELARDGINENVELRDL